MLSVIGFLAVLGPLVIFHEFGHYIFARLFGVKAEIFSVGFGPRIWGKVIGETEWRLSAVPLGGYVKLLGEEGEGELSPEDQRRSLQRQAPWKRFFIFFGGPLFNFILATFVYMAIFAIGEPQTANVVGRVVRGSEAERAGLKTGDRLLSVQGKTVQRWDEVMTSLHEFPNQQVQLQLAREGVAAPLTVTVRTHSTAGFSAYGESTQVGEVDGLIASPRAAVVGISSPSTWAGKAGFKTGDTIALWDGKALKTFEELETRFAGLAVGGSVALGVESKGKPAWTVQLTRAQAADTLTTMGLNSSELFVEKTVDGTPAQKAGLKSGDRIIAIDDQAVESFFSLKDKVQKGGETKGKVSVTWEREGQVQRAEIIPTMTEGRDPALQKTKVFTIGIVPQLFWAEPVTVVERIFNPIVLVFKASERMATMTWKNFVSIGKMFSGDVSVGTLGGPILIGKLAGESISRGLLSFLNIMAILSIGLGVLNILPVPVLDGGHLVLLAIETVRGKPLTFRQMEILQQTGLVLILALMAVVIRNDISRLVN